MFDGAVVKDFVSEFAVEGDVLLRIGEENEFTATVLADILLPVGNEFSADASPLDGRVILAALRLASMKLATWRFGKSN